MNEIKIFNSQESLMTTIHSDGDMISMTDLWKEAGSPKNKDPKFWLRQDSSVQLTETVSGILKVTQDHLIKIKRGKGGGTWAHKQIALAYAKYLDAKLHVMVNQIFFERIEEEKNPELIIDRGIKTYQKLGKSLPWIEKRVNGKLVRNEFTSTLAKHGVEREGFRNCTNNIYDPLWGGGSNVVREKKGLTKDQSIRDNLSLIELTAVSLAELLAAEKITENNIRGNAGCELASKHASSSVKMALLQNKKAIQ